MPSTNDLIAAKLIAEYPGTTASATALLKRYRADNGLEGYEEYVAHVAGASASASFADDENAFWAAFT